MPSAHRYHSTFLAQRPAPPSLILLGPAALEPCHHRGRQPLRLGTNHAASASRMSPVDIPADTGTASPHRATWLGAHTAAPASSGTPPTAPCAIALSAAENSPDASRSAARAAAESPYARPPRVRARLAVRQTRQEFFELDLQYLNDQPLGAFRAASCSTDLALLVDAVELP